MKDIFDINTIKNKRILIKTFVFESGLWYLAKSLGDALKENGNDVCYISKAKYVKENRSGAFKRTYPLPVNNREFDEHNIIRFSNKISVEKQISSAIRKHNADIIISFETLMQTGQWVASLKQKHGVLVYEVPMPEWVTSSFVKNGSYKVFDRIISLTDTCSEVFSDYSNLVHSSWDYVDKSLFNKEFELGYDCINFYHQASTNVYCSHKNTKMVIEAFLLFLKKKKELPVRLVITGSLSKDERALVDESKFSSNILIIDDFLSKRDISDIYKSTHCVIAPSTKEGL